MSDLLDRIKGCEIHMEFIAQVKELTAIIEDRELTIKALRQMLQRTFRANGLPCLECDKFNKLDVKV